MRQWHRWISVIFGVFLLWIAATGLLSQAADLWPEAEPSAQQLAAQQPPAGFTCPAGWRCNPPPGEEGFASLKSFFHHLHSGEEFGPVGVAISIMSRLAKPSSHSLGIPLSPQ